MAIIICGGGPAGTAAAISAARSHAARSHAARSHAAQVILIEHYGFLGGMATAALVGPWMGYYNADTKVIGGIFEEVVENLKQYGAFKQSEHFGNIHYCFDHEILKYVLQKMCLDAGVKILFHSFISGLEIKDGVINGVYTESKSGKEYLPGEFFIDCTGDGDIAYFAGAPYEKGRPGDGLMQPASLHFRLDNVDIKKMPSREQINEKYLSAKNDKKINNPRENVLWFDTPHDNSIHFNTTRITGIDGVKRDDLTTAEIEGRRQMVEIFLFLKENIPGFENSYIAASGPSVGIRETRRIIGDYVLTENDILEARKFEDGVASGCYAVDIHNPEGEGTVIKKLQPDTYYNIPYRCLVPQKTKNLFTAGRPISSTHEAHSSVRIQPACYATGQAAGAAAALCKQYKCDSRALDIKKLRQVLAGAGVIL